MTIQEIYIEKGNDGKCADINDNILHSLKAYGKMPTNFYDEYYGYNAQNCIFRSKKYNCCYMSVYSKVNKEWYNFCGKVNLKNYENSKNFLKDFYEKEIYYTYQYFFELNNNDVKNLKIDCISNKNIFTKTLALFALILLL